MSLGLRRRTPFRKLLFLLLLLASLISSVALAQEGEPGDDAGQEEGTQEAETVQEGSAARLFITNADTSAVPTVILRTYGFTPDGRPLSLNDEPVVVRHAGETIEQTEV